MALRYLLTAMFVALALLNGVCPYFGIKWEYSMTMFSNLNLDGSNHLFMPSADLHQSREYHYVEKFEYDENAPRSAARLKDLLQRIGHLDELRKGDAADDTPIRPVSRNLLAYHIAQLKKSGADFSITLTDEASYSDPNRSQLAEINVAHCPPEWVQYDYFSRYPPIKGDYATITDLIREWSE